MWFGEIPIAYVLARPLGFGPLGAFWCRGQWKLKRV
jgi:hypothetical protein